MKNIFQIISYWSESKKSLIVFLCLSAFLKISMALSIDVVNADAVIYISAAQKFASGNLKEGLDIFSMPFYPLLITLAHYIIPDWLAAAKFTSIITSVLILIPLYFLTEHILGRRAAFWACLLFAIAPFPNSCSVEIIRDNVYLFLFAWAVYYMQRAAQSREVLLFIFAALFSWCSILFRIEGIILVPLYFLWLALLAMKDPLNRLTYTKGILIWLAVPAIALFIIFLAEGPVADSLGGLNLATDEFKSLLQFRFLDSYKGIYEQLKLMEAGSSYPSGNQNFAEIARHLLPLIYLLGLFETLVKVLFPVFVIPLIIGLRSHLNKSGTFVLILVTFYILMVYVTLIARDFMQSRFLYAPAFLLFPWVGAGMERILSYPEKIPKPKILAVVILLAFFISPLYKNAGRVWKQDTVIARVGEWLSEKPEFRDARIITNDPRISLYGGGEKEYEPYYNFNYDLTPLEKIAREKQMDIITIIISVKREHLIPEFQHFRKIRKFVGKKKVAVVLCSPAVYKNLGLAHEDT